MKDWMKQNGLAVFIAFLLGALAVYVLRDSSVHPMPRRDVSVASAPMMQKTAMARGGFAAAPMAEMAMDSVQGNIGMPDPARTIAYSYFWSVQVKNRNAMKERIDALTQGCTAAGEKCELLNASITSDREYPNASFSVRIAPELVGDFRKTAAQNGEMLTDNKSSQQMGDQITDVERRLSVKEGHLQRLEELSKSPGNLEDVLRVQQEISNALSEIESLRFQARAQQKSVQKEVVNINYQVPPPATASTEPVVRAFQEFGRNVGYSVAQVINIVARLLPWVAVLFIAAYLWRGLTTRNWSFRCRHDK